MSGGDCYEAKITFLVQSPPVRTHKILICGQIAGWLWSNGGMEMFDAHDEPSTEHQVRSLTDG